MVIVTQAQLDDFIKSVRDKSKIKHFKIEDLDSSCDCLACLYCTF